MTSDEYSRYKRKLKEHGYTYYPDKPWDGANSWFKEFVKEKGLAASVTVRVFDHTEFEDRISCGFYGIVCFVNEISIKIEPKLGHDPDLDFVDRKMNELIELARAQRVLPVEENEEIE